MHRLNVRPLLHAEKLRGGGGGGDKGLGTGLDNIYILNNNESITYLEWLA